MKIGATDEKGRAPVAVFEGRRVRKLTPSEFMRLQGFESSQDASLSRSSILRMAGNAVPVPMGRFVMGAVGDYSTMDGIRISFGTIGVSGILDKGIAWVIEHQPAFLAHNLSDFLDEHNGESLSAQAAAGLIVRSVRSGQPMPRELFDILYRLASDRSGKLHPSRGNSFEAMDLLGNEISAYRKNLLSVEEYRKSAHTYDTGALSRTRGNFRCLKAIARNRYAE